jgi:hypothetical protein
MFHCRPSRRFITFVTQNSLYLMNDIYGKDEDLVFPSKGQIDVFSRPTELTNVIRFHSSCEK